MRDSPPDLVVADLRMPGLNGLELRNRLLIIAAILPPGFFVLLGIMLFFVMFLLSGSGPPRDALSGAMNSVGNVLPLTHVITLASPHRRRAAAGVFCAPSPACSRPAAWTRPSSPPRRAR